VWIFIMNYGATNVAFIEKDQPHLSVKRSPNFEKRQQSLNKQKFGHESRWDQEPRIAVLAMASIKLLFCPTRPGTRVVRQKNMVMGPTELKTKNDCAAEDQQQITRTNRAGAVKYGN
jgi:hypothetical protein